MRIGVFGLGHLGCVTAACLAKEGHEVVGVDINPTKVELINAGQSPLVEPDLDTLLREVVQKGLLRATMDAAGAVEVSDLSLVSVGTPTNPDGSQSLEALGRVCRDIGQALVHKAGRHLVVVRSTVFPGTLEDLVVPTLEAASGREVGDGYDVAINPEFLREGSSIADFYHPPFIIIGELHYGNASTLEKLYSGISAPLFKTDVRTAEMIKYVCNAFHALKVVFANEMGNLCPELGVNAIELMNIFATDTKLNLSPTYLRPGFAFGGSCLPKDLRTLLYQAGERQLSLPVLEAILPSNEAQITRGVALVRDTGKKNIGVVGLSFKDRTDDLRESAAVKMVRALLDQGLNVQVFDEAVDADLLLGANREFMEKVLPELPSILKSSVETVIASSDVIVLTQKVNSELEVLAHLIRDDQVIVDLVGQEEMQVLEKGRYIGMCW